ncbi:MAG: FliA/WhiG family RNA polymerase sigma factor, partial [Gammaproteobacteria bacterium]
MAGPTDSETLVQAHLPLVKRVAYHMMSRLPASVDVDDLIQAGLIGLLDAAERFDTQQGANFETYASQRIRGAMLDELREADWASRTVRKSSRQIEAAIHILQQRLQRAPTELEIAAELNLDIHAYFELLGETRSAQLVYYEDLGETEGESFLDQLVDAMTDGPFEALAGEGFRKTLARAVSELPEREKFLMGLYYEQDMNF